MTIAIRARELLAEIRLLFTVLSWPQYGCIFWSDQHHGEQFGHYENWASFNEEMQANFERWGIEKPIVIMGSAWRVRLIQWLLRSDRPGLFTQI